MVEHRTCRPGTYHCSTVKKSSSAISIKIRVWIVGFVVDIFFEVYLVYRGPKPYWLTYDRHIEGIIDVTTSLLNTFIHGFCNFIHHQIDTELYVVSQFQPWNWSGLVSGYYFFRLYGGTSMDGLFSVYICHSHCFHYI